MKEASKEATFLRAKEKVKQLKEFYTHGIVYVCVITFLIILNLIVSPRYLWVVFPMIGWGIGVFFHGLSVFNVEVVFGNKWESQKIKEFMDKSNF
ncbi:MAG: histidine kinase [Flavobacteriaceae bacterium]|nr:MAG: histidine kinase [Flavobacteriaceae bacterium]